VTLKLKHTQRARKQPPKLWQNGKESPNRWMDGWDGAFKLAAIAIIHTAATFIKCPREAGSSR